MIPVSGGRVWYRIAGAHRPGRPLLVIHGGPGAPHDYLEPLEALAAERPVVFYDQLGCGNSDRPEDPALWRIDRFVEELAQVREALGLAEVHLLGQSWGAFLATSYVLAKGPAGVASLVLSGPLLSVSRWIADQRAYLAAMPEDVQRSVREAEEKKEFDTPAYQEAMMQYYRRHVCRLDPWPDCLNRTLEKLGMNVYLSMWGPSEFTVTGTLLGQELAERLTELTLPVLFTCGRYDEAAPDTVRYFQGQVPGAELVIFEEASHEHHLEQTAAYLQALRAFLGEAERSRSLR